MTLPGFVLLDKPEGDTSFKTLFPLKRLFATGRVGHAGTLDLRASGLIVAAVGRATRLLPYVERSDKVYTFKIHLGYETDTLEWDGNLVAQGEPLQIGNEAFEAALKDFLGEQLQVPPNYSAIKIGGVRASDISLKGRQVELKPRKIRIDVLRSLGRALPTAGEAGRSFAAFCVECKCSKGTYIRALCRDLGRRLGTFGSVSQIRRTAIGDIQVSRAQAPSALSEGSLIPVQEIVPFPVLTLSPTEIQTLRNGNWLPYAGEIQGLGEDGLLFAASSEGQVQTLCRFEPGRISPKLFLGQDEV